MAFLRVGEADQIGLGQMRFAVSRRGTVAPPGLRMAIRKGGTKAVARVTKRPPVRRARSPVEMLGDAKRSYDRIRRVLVARRAKSSGAARTRVHQQILKLDRTYEATKKRLLALLPKPATRPKTKGVIRGRTLKFAVPQPPKPPKKKASPIGRMLTMAPPGKPATAAEAAAQVAPPAPPVDVVDVVDLPEPLDVEPETLVSAVDEGMSNTTKLAIGGAALLGLVLVLKRKK